jgi:drug/metabolite transporter (DMT)-like permease
MTDALVVFVAMAITDALWAIYIRRTNEGRAIAAGVLAALLLALGGVVVVYYTKNPWLLLVAALGAFVGTFLTVKHDARTKADQ